MEMGARHGSQVVSKMSVQRCCSVVRSALGLSIGLCLSLFLALLRAHSRFLHSQACYLGSLLYLQFALNATSSYILMCPLFCLPLYHHILQYIVLYRTCHPPVDPYSSNFTVVDVGVIFLHTWHVRGVVLWHWFRRLALVQPVQDQ